MKSVIFGLVTLAGASGAADGPPVDARALVDGARSVTYDPPLPIEARPSTKCSTAIFKPTEPDNSGSIALQKCFPKFPTKCLRDAKRNEAVLVLYNVSPDGIPNSLRIKKTTQDCFNKEAARSVATWRYPSSEAEIVDAETIVSFHLD